MSNVYVAVDVAVDYAWINMIFIGIGSFAIYNLKSQSPFSTVVKSRAASTTNIMFKVI